MKTNNDGETMDHVNETLSAIRAHGQAMHAKLVRLGHDEWSRMRTGFRAVEQGELWQLFRAEEIEAVNDRLGALAAEQALILAITG